jgi:hypothetical protein
LRAAIAHPSGTAAATAGSDFVQADTISAGTRGRGEGRPLNESYEMLCLVQRLSFVAGARLL